MFRIAHRQQHTTQNESSYGARLGFFFFFKRLELSIGSTPPPLWSAVTDARIPDLLPMLRIALDLNYYWNLNIQRLVPPKPIY